MATLWSVVGGAIAIILSLSSRVGDLLTKSITISLMHAAVIPAIALLFLIFFASACPAVELEPISLSYFDGRLYPLSAALDWDWLGLDFKLGWLPLDWGPSPGYDLSFSATRGHFMLYMTGDFSGMELIPPFHWEQAYIRLEPRAGAGRLMIARRYEVEAGRWTLGYVEAALLTGDYSLWYLNPYPLIPLEVTQLALQYLGAESGENLYCNMIMDVDVKYHGDGFQWYISFYVDDLPPTAEWVSHYKIGLQAGLEVDRPFNLDGTRLWLDYTAITRHTYSYWAEWPQGDYVDGSLLIGHPLGPDADLLTIRLTWQDRKTWVELQRERHGEGRFPDPMDPVTEQTLEFLTGVVETSYWLKAGRAFALGERLELCLELGAAHVANLDNTAGKTGSGFCLNMQVEYEF